LILPLHLFVAAPKVCSFSSVPAYGGIPAERAAWFRHQGRDGGQQMKEKNYYPLTG